MLRILLSGLLLFFSAELLAQTPLVITRMTGTINFDGIPDEEVWHSISPVPMIMYVPVAGASPTEESIVKLAYDDDYLYLSAYLNHSDPANIRAVGKKRDYAMPATDWFGLIIDSFNDRQNAFAFWTNPNGLRTDGTVKNDCNDSETDINFSWNTFWDVKTVINPKGWSVEERIPFSSLRFQAKGGKTVMGIIITRFDAAKYETSTFPPVPAGFSNAFWKPSLSSLIEFNGLKPRKPVYITPYATAGIGQVNELNEEGTEYIMSLTPKYDAGLDAKYSITNNLTVDLTLNTDFAQVEADDEKINLTRYSLYFPEKRMFFQEKSDVFDFSFLEGNNLFYSRKIGLHEGSPVRIYGGMRMTGRAGKWDLGILDMQTAPIDSIAGENFGILRTKRNVFNQNSYVGGILTSRVGMNGRYNFAYGADAQLRITGDEYITVKWAQTFENDSVNRAMDMSPSRLMFNWERRTIKGFGYNLLYSWSGERFNPGLGFETIDTYQGFKGTLQYGWYPGEKKKIYFHKISLIENLIWNSATGFHETTSSTLKWHFESKKGAFGIINATWSLENLVDSIPLGNDQAYVPPGEYSFINFGATYATTSSNILSSVFAGEAGTFFDGRKLSLSASPTLIVSSGISLGLTYYLDYVSFESRDARFTNHIAGLKALFTFTTKTSLSAFIQYNTAVEKVSANIRFRYNPREGNDFYLVYDEGLNTRLHRETPSLPSSSGRTILLKYAYTFRF
jgi:hypothetical protein